MNYEVYCDESCVEALFDKESHKYAVIGGVWIPSESRSELKIALNKIKEKYNLRDPDAELYVGYESKSKSYTRSKRVAVVKNNYVVVIQIYADKKAKFITAYVADNSIDKIKEGPKWVDTKKNAD